MVGSVGSETAMTATGTASAARSRAVTSGQLGQRLDELEQHRSAEVEARLLGARQVEDEALSADLAV